MNTDSPLFSVLIANFNNGKYLMDAIESVKAQTYTNWEIILLDDGSTDNSFSLYMKMEQDPRIRIFYNGENKGCGFTKRKCIEMARGEICGFLDADDVLTSDAIQTMVNAHINYPNCSLIYSQFYYTNESLIVIEIPSHQCDISPNESFLTHKNMGAISHFATFKKKMYEKTDGIDSMMLCAVDKDLYFKLEEVGDLKFIPAALYYYRCGTGNNVSIGNGKEEKAFFWEIVARIEACRRRGVSIENVVFPIIEDRVLEMCKESYHRGEDHIRGTKSYRIIRKLVNLLKWK